MEPTFEQGRATFEVAMSMAGSRERLGEGLPPPPPRGLPPPPNGPPPLPPPANPSSSAD
jgi:hypothetical protein